MKYTFAISTPEELERYQAFRIRNQSKLRAFIDHLQSEYEVHELPEFVVLANRDMATRVIRENSVPAYTNKLRTVITPDAEVWSEIYIGQLTPYQETAVTRSIRSYYTSSLTDAHILQILGHELAHQSDLFLDDFEMARPEGIWLEEGMVEYLSRSFFFTKEEFAAEKEINLALVKLYEEHFGRASLEAFGEDTYAASDTVIYYHYWKSFLTVDALVSALGSPHEVFKNYHEWDQQGRPTPLAKWFGLEA